MKRLLLLLVLPFTLLSCRKQPGPDPTPPASTLYFPPLTGNTWETVSPASLGWDAASLNAMLTWLGDKNTKGFLILHRGRIAVERYYGSFNADSNWYWASAGKTLTAFLAGIAQHEGILNIQDPVSKYLGPRWTSLTTAQENAITVRHQLTMTTGLDDFGARWDCTDPECLVYKAPPGTRWAYHNAPYTLLESVISAASRRPYNLYFNDKIRSRIGMNGIWLPAGQYNTVYWSTPRSMARFGLLLLANGAWNGTDILADKNYLRDMTTPSQTLNRSYGYLTWLNGQASHMLPLLQLTFNGPLFPNAPADMYAALGKDDQKLYVVPSRKLVVVRMGDAAGGSQLAPSSFDNELWGYLKDVIR